jgi:tetratricopeptide (TPR) repeat protein
MKKISLALLLLILAAAAFAQNEKDPKVDALFDQAEKLMDTGDAASLNKAVAIYDQIVKLAPEDPDAFNGRGFSYLRLGNLDKAIADFDKVLELKPDDYYTYYTRGKAYYLKGDYERAVEDHNKEIELESVRDIGRLERGYALIKLGRAGEALPDFNRVIAFSDMAAGFYARAAVFEKKGDKTAAMADLRYYLDRVPDDMEARLWWVKLGGPAGGMPAQLIKGTQTPLAQKAFAEAFSNLRQAWYYEAVDALAKLIKAEPKNAAAWFYRGWILEMQASELNGKKTIADYTRAIQLDPKFTEAYLRRAYRYTFGNAKLAIPDVAKARLLEPKNAHAAYFAALAQNRDDRWPKALLLFTEDIKLDPGYADAYIARADGYLEKKLFEKAIADFAAVIKLNPNDYRGYEGRAKAYCEQKKKDLAVADEEKAAALGAEVSFPCGD